ncbi:hypothetical protein CMUS01_12855 [Colletotrichum musicola]|uniref:Uncharacterized protein n=1 Tax=Colletotrichum musicola TaxID=2175873 RepID=A0A8H6JHH5_9PEZI|nr:hypothetical protein CMUS01_12855 [Colletotrichum musicola]
MSDASSRLSPQPCSLRCASPMCQAHAPVKPSGRSLLLTGERETHRHVPCLHYTKAFNVNLHMTLPSTTLQLSERQPKHPLRRALAGALADTVALATGRMRAIRRMACRAAPLALSSLDSCAGLPC